MLFSKCSIAGKYNFLEEKFLRAYEWLEKTDIASLEPGSYPIMGDTVVASVQVYDTFPPEEGVFETHEKFFDIQYVVSGIEAFGICKRDGLTVKSANPDRDIIFYEEPEHCGYVILKEGDLVVVAPEDAHKPRCQVGNEPCHVVKVVVKVAV